MAAVLVDGGFAAAGGGDGGGVAVVDAAADVAVAVVWRPAAEPSPCLARTGSVQWL